MAFKSRTPARGRALPAGLGPCTGNQPYRRQPLQQRGGQPRNVYAPTQHGTCHCGRAEKRLRREKPQCQADQRTGGRDTGDVSCRRDFAGDTRPKVRRLPTDGKRHYTI